MANKLALSLVIGGAVASSLGSTFNTVEGRIKRLEDKGNKAKVLKSTIGETIRLREEWRKAHESGAAGADKLLQKFESNVSALRKQGVEVGKLNSEYKRLGRAAQAADLQLKGHQQVEQGKAGLKSNLGQAAIGIGLAAVPTKISADYQAIIRDIAIKSDIVNKPEEAQLSRTVIDTAKDTGMSRNDVADLVNQLVGAGMDVKQALAYAPTAAKFAIGQGSNGVDTASMIMALQQNAKISDPKVMEQALEAIAYQGQAGSFEASDMAKWFPQLLAGMEKNGITGLDAVTSLGSMLQVQMKTAGSSDEAANNFKNWMEKLGAGDIKKNYEKAGIDYQGSLNTGLQKGMNVIEASMALAMKYVESTDPAKAKKMQEAQANIDKEVDPVKAKAALEALEKTLRTGDIFADMQVKAALTAYGQNRGLYEELKADSQKASGILDKNLAERRETSAQRWAELGQAVDDSMRSIGDAIRPATDAAAQALTWVARGLTKLSDGAQPVVLGVAAITAAFMAFKTASSALKIGRGALNIMRGNALERGLGRGRGAAADIQLPKTGNKVLDNGIGALGKVFGAASANDGGATPGNEPQRVFVVNANAIGGNGPASAPGAAGGRNRNRRGQRGSRARGRRSVSRTAAPAPGLGAAAKSLPKASLLSAAPAAAGGLSGIGAIARNARQLTRLGKRLPGGSLLDAGVSMVDVAMNANTPEEKAEGYGGAAGGMGGALAGAAAGAAIGSVVPVIGTMIGGAIGAALGGMGGEALGGWLGKSLLGGDKPKAEQVAAAPTGPAPAGALPVTTVPVQGQPSAPGAVVRAMAQEQPTAPKAQELAKAADKPAPPAPKIDQQFAFSPSLAITVQGDVKDPSQLANELMPHMRAQFEAFSREVAARQTARQMYDEPHV